MSQCMRRLNTPDGTEGAFSAQLSAWTFSNLAGLNARGEAKGLDVRAS
jgi:hypothetical protein